MQRLLQLSFVGVLTVGNAIQCFAADNMSCQPGEISNRPECLASEVYVGDDRDMPLDGEFKIALLKRDPKQKTPETIKESLIDVEKVLPRWYISALRRSKGNEECDVIVNGVSYSAIVVNWLWTAWNMSAKDSPLRRSYEKLGITGQDNIQQALIFGICEFVKNGPDEALETIRKRGAHN